MPRTVTTLTTRRPTTARYLHTDARGITTKKEADLPGGQMAYRGLDAARDGTRYICVVGAGTFMILDAEGVTAKEESA